MEPSITVGVRVLAGSFLVVMMFALGLEVASAPPKDKRTKRHERRLLVRALLLNLVLMPMVAFALVRLLRLHGSVATAVLLVAATPGGRFAPRVATIARAELGLAIEVTLFLAKLTAFTAPVTIKWLLGVPKIELRDLLIILQLLVLQMIPYLVGRTLGRKRPGVRASLGRPLLVAEAMIGTLFFAVLLFRGDLGELRAAGAAEWGAGLAFAFVCLGLGWLLGGPEAASRRTFAVTTSARNLGLALVIASAAFPGAAVSLAVFAIWLICLVADMGFATAVRARRGAPVVAHLRPGS